jgi:hypothetical protein
VFACGTVIRVIHHTTWGLCQISLHHSHGTMMYM